MLSPASAKALLQRISLCFDLKRRHSWSSDLDFQPQSPERVWSEQPADQQDFDHDLDGDVRHVPDLVETCRLVDRAGLSSDDDDEDDDDDGGGGGGGGGGGAGDGAGDEEDEEEEEEEKEEPPDQGWGPVLEEKKEVVVVVVGEGRAREEQDMGQRSSSFLRRSSRPKISLTWVLRGDPTAAPAAAAAAVTTASADNNNKGDVVEQKVVPAAEQDEPRPDQKTSSSSSAPPKRTLSEPSLAVCAVGRERTRHRRSRTPRHKAGKQKPRFGYEIQDVDAFLSKASLEKPANIPMVLSCPCTLYQTRPGGHQDEVRLPLGMVVNAVFKNQSWLYVQTPHGEEGYVGYGACLPLGILPQRSSSQRPAPCWETHADVFPRPTGNRTDSEKLRDGTRSECGRPHHRRRGGDASGRPERDAVSACGERSVDRLYLRAAASAKRGEDPSATPATATTSARQTLLVIRSDYSSKGRNTLSVAKGDVVALVSGHLKDWFWVRSRDGKEGFIPSVVAGHGFL